MPSVHAKLSPSSAARWITCPGSVALSATVPCEDTGSSFAREGTLAHTLAEIEASLTFGLITRDEYRMRYDAWTQEMEAEFSDAAEERTEEMTEAVGGYLDLLEEHGAGKPGYSIFLEQRVSTGVTQSWGTSDAVIVGTDTVEIVDLKYGRGVEVDAVSNPQLMLYALGAVRKYADIVNPATVSMTVYQPRLRHVDTWTVSLDYLTRWRDETARPAAKEALSGEGHFQPSEVACKWCPAAAVCKPRADWVVRHDFEADPNTLTPEEIARLLPRLPVIEKFIKDTTAEALRLAYSGEGVPGYKAVRAAGRRKIVDETEAIKRLTDRGYSVEAVSVNKIKPLGALEKVVGRGKLSEALGDTLTKSEGLLKIVEESARGEAVTRDSEAGNEFDVVEEAENA